MLLFIRKLLKTECFPTTKERNTLHYIKLIYSVHCNVLTKCTELTEKCILFLNNLPFILDMKCNNKGLLQGHC